MGSEERSVLLLVLEPLPQLVQRELFCAVAQLGVGPQHTALAKVAGPAGAGAQLLAAGGQLLGQLLQLQQLGGALGRALGGQLDGSGRFGGVELGDFGSPAGRVLGLLGLQVRAS